MTQGTPPFSSLPFSSPPPPMIHVPITIDVGFHFVFVTAFSKIFSDDVHQVRELPTGLGPKWRGTKAGAKKKPPQPTSPEELRSRSDSLEQDYFGFVFLGDKKSANRALDLFVEHCALSGGKGAKRMADFCVLFRSGYPWFADQEVAGERGRGGKGNPVRREGGGQSCRGESRGSVLVLSCKSVSRCASVIGTRTSFEENC